MKLREFGNQDLLVSPIGLGMAALGRPGYINLGHAEDLQHNYDVDAMRSHSHQVLQTAYDAGVRYFDAARSYGRAEQFLASWLTNDILKDAPTIGSKWGYTYTADWQIDAEHHEVKEHALPVLIRQWQESLQLLGENLNIYHIHSATLDSGVLENYEVLERLWELKSHGIVVGLSLSGTGQADTLRKALTIESEGEKLFGSVQLTFNILEQSNKVLYQEASDVGLGIIVKESLANGRLTSRNQAPEFAEKAAVLNFIADAYETSIDAIAMAYVLAHDWCSVVLSGAANEAHLLSNLEAAKINLDRTDIETLDKLAEDIGVYWKTRSALAWN
ncbi:MAG: aldo/keto reductase [Lentisphaeria bacterium]|nr:aldo/keto reductase [Lentisphaeria bacterium]